MIGIIGGNSGAFFPGWEGGAAVNGSYWGGRFFGHRYFGARYFG